MKYLAKSVVVVGIGLLSLRGSCVAIDEAISGACYYFMRLPHSLRLFAMTIFDPHNNG
ncbi:hypothetical protein [Rickettsia hoogstraalii]|uniref:hypothetical protein n=1 Tax=Rickettsia hoogstraalii TaxID=467174 RepID=UPI000B2FD006|nr:hypothetical protein [Rickettsia hoogstraalii]